MGDIFEIREKEMAKYSHSLSLPPSPIIQEMQTSRYIDVSKKEGGGNFMRAFGEMDTLPVRLTGTNFLESIVYQYLNPVTHGFQV